MSQDSKETPEEVARQALASLRRSVSLTESQSMSRQRSNSHQEKTGKVNSNVSPLMGALWALMTDLYGHKWTSVHGDRDDTDNWGKAMYGITKHQMAGAVKALMVSGDPWPPSAPEFRALCEAGNSNLGIPTPEAAWREAVEASTDPVNWKFSHPIVHEAARLTDWYSIRNGVPKAETVQNRFNKRYADLTAKLQRGEPLVDGQLAISQELRQGAMDIADAKAELELKNRMIKQGLKGKSPEQLRDELRAKMGIKR